MERQSAGAAACIICGANERLKKKDLTDTARPANADWPGWRGAARDARVQWLPDELPKSAEFLWSAPLTGDGIGGLAVGHGCVIVGSRDLLDQHDVFQCLQTSDGEELWQHFYPAPGKLDYGNSPRATPLIHRDLVYTLGAHGHLYCLELESGLPLWSLNLVDTFGAPELTWGHSGSPLIVDGKLIVQPGGPQASIVALDPETGDVIWKTPGKAPGYSSLISGTFGGQRQVIGYDADTLGGWNVSSGERLWTLVPPVKGDFNVPTPLRTADSDLLVATENNGLRRYSFTANGRLQSTPVAVNETLTPDSHTPVLSGHRVYGISDSLLGLDAVSLKEEFSDFDDAFSAYGSLIATDDRLLCLSGSGELLLISTDTQPPQILSRLQIASSTAELLSHPAVAGDSIYVRRGRQLSRLVLRP